MKNDLHIETILIVRLIKYKNKVISGWIFYMDIKSHWYDSRYVALQHCAGMYCS